MVNQNIPNTNELIQSDYNKLVKFSPTTRL